MAKVILTQSAFVPTFSFTPHLVWNYPHCKDAIPEQFGLTKLLAVKVHNLISFQMAFHSRFSFTYLAYFCSMDSSMVSLHEAHNLWQSHPT